MKEKIKEFIADWKDQLAEIWAARKWWIIAIVVAYIL